MLEGIIDLSLWNCLFVVLLLTHITIAGVTIFLHRYQAHNALTMHPVASHFFRYWLWLTTGIVTKEWVAVHRKHHVKCETPEDPHSPQIESVWKVLFGGVGLYRAAARDKQTLEHYGKGTPDDWLEHRVYSRYPSLGIAIMVTFDMFLFGLSGLIIFAIQMAWIPFFAAGVINGLGHYIGYRNCETPDASRNLFPFGILIGGEELHNNHHAYAQSARLSNRWWEFDIGWFYIKILALFGLVRVRRVAPKIRIDRDKKVVDLETFRAVARDRYHVLTLYGRKVIRPAIRAEFRASHGIKRSLLRQARKLMTREDIQLNLQARATLNEALQQSQTLETVYRFKAQLKALWTQTASDHTNRVERLKNWCSEAESSGIKVLQDFARLVRGYTLQAG